MRKLKGNETLTLLRATLERQEAARALRRGRLLDQVEACYRAYAPAQCRPGTTAGKAWRDVVKRSGRGRA